MSYQNSVTSQTSTHSHVSVCGSARLKMRLMTRVNDSPEQSSTRFKHKRQLMQQRLFLRAEAQPQCQRHPGFLNGGWPSHRVDLANMVGTVCHTGGVQALVTAYGQAGSSTKATITAPSGKDIKSRTPQDYGTSRREVPVHVLTSRSSATKWENNHYYITYICKTIK